MYGTSGTFNSAILTEHFIKVIESQIPAFSDNDQPFNLLIDSAPCHKNAEFKSALEARGIRLHLIPPRLTNTLKPADVSWMKELKDNYRLLWNDWMKNSPKSLTASNNTRPPGYALVPFF